MTTGDYASIGGFLWAIGATIFGVCKTLSKRQSEALTHRFLVGLAVSASGAQLKAINDELERIKPSKQLIQKPVN